MHVAGRGLSPGGGRPRLPRAGRVALVLVVVYGALLRVDALVQRYGPFDGPAWLRAAAAASAVVVPLRPPGFLWPHESEPYVGGDPINYLRFAREMHGFYQGHVREPAFLALTRAWLWLTGGRDISVSLASMSASIAAVPATWALGAAVGSAWGGLFAAAALAIDYDAVTWAPEGWRDDLFMLMVTLAAWALVRLRQEPTARRALVAGVLAGLACLTRITAVSFVLPAAVWLVLGGVAAGRALRLRGVAVMLAVATVVVAPYLINTARMSGDPFLALNAHTVYYRAAEGLPSDMPQTAAAYVRTKLVTRPIAALDTALTGLFVVPFLNKGLGFGFWWLRLPGLLHALMAAGLVLWLWSADGRLLALIAVSSLVPYALTWNLGGGGEWRFTMHVYPLLLLAAAGVVDAAWRIVRARGGWPESWRRPRRGEIVTAAFVPVLALACIFAYRHLPFLVAREAILAGASTTVGAGPRDEPFFRAGWLPPRTDGNVTARVSDGDRATLRVPLPYGPEYQLVFRLDPVAQSAPSRVAVLLNRHLVGHLDLGWDPDRVGTYPLTIPATLVGRGHNDIELVADTAVPAGRADARYADLPPDRRIAFRFWYVRVIPGVKQESGVNP